MADLKDSMSLASWPVAGGCCETHGTVELQGRTMSAFLDKVFGEGPASLPASH